MNYIYKDLRSSGTRLDKRYKVLYVPNGAILGDY